MKTAPPVELTWLLHDRTGRYLNSTTKQLPAVPLGQETDSVLFSEIIVDLVINRVGVMEQ